MFINVTSSARVIFNFRTPLLLSSMCKKCEFWKLLIRTTIIPTANPSPIPIRRSVKMIPSTVTMNGTNCFHPCLYIEINSLGLASLYPTTNNMDARTDNGILLRSFGIINTESNNKKPWTIADVFVFPPD